VVAARWPAVMDGGAAASELKSSFFKFFFLVPTLNFTLFSVINLKNPKPVLISLDLNTKWTRKFLYLSFLFDSDLLVFRLNLVRPQC